MQDIFHAWFLTFFFMFESVSVLVSNSLCLSISTQDLWLVFLIFFNFFTAVSTQASFGKGLRFLFIFFLFTVIRLDRLTALELLLITRSSLLRTRLPSSFSAAFTESADWKKTNSFLMHRKLRGRHFHQINTLQQNTTHLWVSPWRIG